MLPTENRPHFIWWRFLLGMLAGIAVSLPLTLGIDSMPVRITIGGLWAVLFGYMFARPMAEPVDRRKYVILLAMGIVVFIVMAVGYLVTR